MAQFDAIERQAQMMRLAAQAKQLAREAAWELDKAQMTLHAATAQVDLSVVEQHRVRAMERLAQAMAAGTEWEMTMAKLQEPTSATVHRAAHSR